MSDPVKDFFEQTDVYLTFNYNLRIRMETLGYFLKQTGRERFENVLDMPCGTGDISLPFLDKFDKLTMMDFAENMVATAKSKTPEDQMHKVRFIRDDFYLHDFGDEKFDLVMNIGIMAHIRNPWRFLEASMKLVKPGGFLVLQNTDADHLFSKMIFGYLALRRAVGKDRYAFNKVPEKELLPVVEAQGFELLESFRYNQSFLGLSRMFGNETKYRMTRKYFGFAENPRKQKSGSDVTYLFQKKG